MKKPFLVIILILLSLCVYGASNTGKIIRVLTGPTYSNLAFIKIAPDPASRPACSTNTNWHYTVRIDNDTGKATLSVILTAHSSGKTVTVNGFETCNNYPNVDDLKYIYTRE